jgi:NADH-quinone oxidoreductase subunit J
MEFTSILFYVFSLFFVGSSLVMITSRNTAKAALWLILTFFSAASLWLLLEAEFLAITLILIYVGAVMVLFMFVIKMLDTEESTLRAQFTRYLPLGIFVSLVVIVQMALVLNAGPFDLESVGMPEQHGASYSNITAIAQQLYTIYVYPFELAAILLLIAIIAAITLVHRTQVNIKKQNITEQINVQAKDRMRFASINKKSKKESK